MVQAWLGVQVDPSRHVIELDSTSGVKYSRHITVQLRRAWRHNGHVHAFMTRFVEVRTPQQAHTRHETHLWHSTCWATAPVMSCA